MDILKNENKGEEEEDEILNDEQINEDIARNEEEFNKFQEMDQERYIREKRDQRLEEIKEKLNLKIVCAHVNHKLRKESDDEEINSDEFYEVEENIAADVDGGAFIRRGSRGKKITAAAYAYQRDGLL